ncbi:COP9 signalosome complex subunit 7a [Dinochytrium kinnereticum]|nr:COP9 signalosome complex subunit 7a [Dinochytrium kinnereticum]
MSNSLQTFLLLAKSAKGTACTQLIQDALNANGVFVFAELLEVPNVKELQQSPQFKQYYDLLSLFAYGTYEDYKANSHTLPQLTPNQLKKLKQLSIVTFSSTERILSYDKLLKYLDIPNVRALEDLLIDAIYQDIIKGKLDQKRGCVEIQHALGRDLKPGQAALVLDTLKGWSRITESLLKTIDNRLAYIKNDTLIHAKEKEDLEKMVEQLKKDEKSKAPMRGSSNEFDSFDPRREQFHGMFDEEGSRRAGAGRR